MIRTGWCLLGAIVLSAGNAAAQSEEGVEIGLRTGYGIALGKTYADDSLNDVVAGQIPVWLDLGYRLTPNVMIGLYGAYGFGFVGGATKDACDAGVSFANAASGLVTIKEDCSAHDIRFGAQVHYHFTPEKSMDPWVGAGFGYEWLSNSGSGSFSGLDLKLTNGLHGFEFINLQGGLDFKPDDDANAGIGPFIALSIGQYSKQSLDCSGNLCDRLNFRGQSVTVDDKAVHEWLTIGVRGTYVP